MAIRLGTLAPGEEREIAFEGVPQQEGDLAACTSVAFQPSLCSTIAVGRPTLALERWITVDGERVTSAYACDELQLHYRVTNTGTGLAEDVRITDALPEGLRTADGGGAIELPVGGLEGGASAEKTVTLQASSAVSLAQPATATSAAAEARSQTGEALTIMQPAIELSVDAPRHVYLGRDARIAVRVANPSQHPARDVVVAVPLPDDAERVSVSSGRVERDDGAFRIGRLGAGETVDFAIDFTPRKAGRLDGEVVAKAYCVEERRAALQTEIAGIPAIRLEMIDIRDPVPVGENSGYNIRVKNQGSADDTDIRLTAEIPEGFEVVSASGKTDVRTEGRRLTFAPLERLAPGDTADWRIEVRALKPGEATCRIEMSSSANQQPVSEQEPTRAF
ncbi:MAG TPA: hypothetical protein VEL07_14910 [Planctomycetota bacterium]|nr:hypothetical protein [Planctomycetota bacterium]